MPSSIETKVNVIRPATARASATASLLALAGMNVVWGAGFPVTKLALDSLSPFVFTFLRFALAAVFLLPFVAAEVSQLLRGPDRNRVFLMGILGMSVAQVAQSLSIHLSTASDISLLATTTPVWIALLAALWLGERLDRRSVAGLGLAMVGILVVIWPHQMGAWGSNRVLGDLVSLITGISWAAYNVLGKSITERHSPMVITAASILVGTVANLPFAVYELLAGQPQRFSLPAVSGIAYAGLLVTALGFPILFWALRSVRVNQTGILMYLQPLAGTLLGWAFLGETLSVRFFLGGVLVLLGVGLVAVWSRRAAAGGPSEARDLETTPECGDR